jgi:dTDP-4-amino-4,6-dideoxygalactose transaminase
MNQHARMNTASIPFIDVGAQRRRLGRAIDDAVARVLAHCQFIMGPEVGALEAELARFCGARHAISCGSGTEALMLVLMAKGIGPGDAVFCPTFTFCATAEVVALVGANPVLCDVDEGTFNLDTERLKRALGTAKRLGLRPRAVIPVDLFGLPAELDAIGDIAADNNLFVLDDAAQAFGATHRGRPLGLGALAAASATSFFPAKPLGCFGDGGAVFTDDDELASIIKSLRVHGEGVDKYDTVRIGITGRLDTIQAAILLEKLKIFPDEIAARNRVALRYASGLADVLTIPQVPAHCTSVWAQYTVRVAPNQREALIAALRGQGIPTAVYYRKPLHWQEAYRRFPIADGGLAVSERLASEVVSLPMHAYLDEPTQDRIIEAVRRALPR